MTTVLRYIQSQRVITLIHDSTQHYFRRVGPCFVCLDQHCSLVLSFLLMRHEAATALPVACPDMGQHGHVESCIAGNWHDRHKPVLLYYILAYKHAGDLFPSTSAELQKDFSSIKYGVLSGVAVTSGRVARRRGLPQRRILRIRIYSRPPFTPRFELFPLVFFSIENTKHRCFYLWQRRYSTS